MEFSRYTTLPTDKVLAELKVISDQGLTATEVEKRQVAFGKNALPIHITHWWQIVLRQFKSSFVYLLLSAAALSFILREYIDGGMVVMFVVLNAVLGFFQEFRSEKTSQLLKQYTVPHSHVRRDGKVVNIPSETIVPGDILVLEAGDIIPADARVLCVTELLVDETILTGESVSVDKSVKPAKEDITEVYQAHNVLFSGTTVMSGQGEAVVFATANKTVMGGVAQLATEAKRPSSFEQEINHFSSFILKLVIVTLICVMVIHLILRGGQTNVVDLIIFAIALAVGVIPEALPVVTTFSLSRGALHLAKHKVVVKRLTAIEDLGSIEVLCTDKTGTITENKLTVAEVLGDNRSEVLKFATWACETDLHDPFDQAIQKASGLALPIAKQNIPFDPARRRNSVLVDGTLVVRGAPEVLFPNHPQLDAWMSEQGGQGRRMLAVGKKTFSGDHYQVTDEVIDLEWVGLISFMDPIKASTQQAVTEAKQLGVQVKIITGDGKEVAGAVAKQIGLITDLNDVIIGTDLLSLSHDAQLAAVKKYNVFARISPEEKYNIIQLLQHEHQVGFLGEGINDAPALKVANISLVVQGASDIARESADVILLEQSLEVVIDGIREGREVFANTMKYIQATLSSNFGNFYAIAIVSLFIDFLPMLPLQILLVNLLSDFPMITIAADNVAPEELDKPKNYHIRDILLLATFLGIVSTVFDFIFFAIFSHEAPAVLQTGWFMGSVLTELAFLFSIRNRRFFLFGKPPAAFIIGLTGVAAITTVVVPFTNFGHRVFQFVNPTRMQLMQVFAVVAAYFVTTEVVKLMYYRRNKEVK